MSYGMSEFISDISDQCETLNSNLALGVATLPDDEEVDNSDMADFCLDVLQAMRARIEATTTPPTGATAMPEQSDYLTALETIGHDPAARDWLKDQCLTLDRRDPVDALVDAAALYQLQQLRARALNVPGFTEPATPPKRWRVTVERTSIGVERATLTVNAPDANSAEFEALHQAREEDQQWEHAHTLQDSGNDELTLVGCIEVRE